MINPQIIESSGEQTGEEGCLSVPGKFGIVTRPDRVKVRAFDENMNEFEMEGEGLLARAFCHELDHLDGNCMLNWQKTDFMKCLMMKKIKTMRKEGKNENHIYGNTRFSVGTLEALVEAGHDVCLAVTQPDKPKAEEKKCSLRL